jgi:hypothetical protein
MEQFYYFGILNYSIGAEEKFTYRKLIMASIVLDWPRKSLYYTAYGAYFHRGA